MHNSIRISLPLPADQQQKQTEIAICSQNCVWNLEFAIDFWCLQLTFDVFNWVYSKHMIHYNKVNWKNFAKNFLKIFPIDFQSSIDFSQLHMIRPLMSTIKNRDETGFRVYTVYTPQIIWKIGSGQVAEQECPWV